MSKTQIQPKAKLALVFIGGCLSASCLFAAQSPMVPLGNQVVSTNRNVVSIRCAEFSGERSTTLVRSMELSNYNNTMEKK